MKILDNILWNLFLIFRKYSRQSLSIFIVITNNTLIMQVPQENYLNYYSFNIIIIGYSCHSLYE